VYRNREEKDCGSGSREEIFNSHKTGTMKLEGSWQRRILLYYKIGKIFAC
jgi:hypothetical protein